MISPHTKPGTKIVCIDDAPGGKYNNPPLPRVPNMNGLTRDTVYTVKAIVPSNTARLGFNVLLREITRRNPTHGFALERFRYLELPRSLTELLETAPVCALSELEPTQ